MFFSAAASNALQLGATEGKIYIQRGSQQLAEFAAETASAQKAIEKGLAGRPSIPDGSAMLFILDSSKEQFFWMKGMEFSIDILFFDKEKRLIEVLQGLLPCEVCEKYKAPAGTGFVLETNAGLADKLGLKTGDRFVFEDRQ